MSAVSTPKKRGKRKKNYTKPELPFHNDVVDAEPIPALSPILCNYHFPQLDLVSAEDHGMYWVSPQCDTCGVKQNVRTQKTRRAIRLAEKQGSTCAHKCALSQPDRAAYQPQHKEVVSIKELSAKERFCTVTASKPFNLNDSILVPETPPSEQGMTLRERLIQKSRKHCNSEHAKES